MLLPSAVYVSSLVKREVSGDWETRYSVVFQIGSFVKYVYVYMCILCSLFFVVVCILFCAKEKRRSGDESRHHRKGKTDEISVLSLLSSYLR